MHTNTITIEQWTEKQFKDSKDDWNTLLDRSSADRLFLSWEWLYSWWDIFSEPDSMQLKLFIAKDGDGNLIGIAPLYLAKIITKKIIPTKRLEFIGGCWRGKATMRTELLSFISEPVHSQEIVRALYQHISKDADWDEFVLADLTTQSNTYQILKNEKPLGKAYYRLAENYKSYYLTLIDSFDSYVKKLGKNTRLRLFNRRKTLAKTGSVYFEKEAPHDVCEKFDLLNEFHLKRWGRPAFSDKRLNFNITVAELLAQRNALSISTLYVDKKPVSIQYNYLLGSHEYNIQAGFDESYHKKIALGYLHFGYEIENAYTQEKTIYDFLAGEGKNASYKEHLTESSFDIVEIQIIRSKHLIALYRLYDFLRKTRD